MPKLSPDLKEAILRMPTAEKDKLLLRLVAKDEKLCQKLEYELLEEGTSLEERRTDIRETIDRLAVGHHYSPGWLMMDMRGVNGLITAHVKTTKDKMGEISLTLYLLNRVYDEQMPHLAKYSSRSDTLAAYVAKRTQFIVQKLEKLHPDYYIEFEEDVNKLLAHVHTTAPARYAQELHLPRQWQY
ncbi:MAG: hypothetical protein ICV83_04470 [Cytophagales bacterium]|nr:hypothetical protein [Cytophagales bacterium]